MIKYFNSCIFCSLGNFSGPDIYKEETGMPQGKIMPEPAFRKCISDQIGNLAENIIEQALRGLMGDNIIIDFDKPDKGGIDYTVKILKPDENGGKILKIHFQVKSSYNYVEAHLDRGGKNPVPVIVMRVNKNDLLEISRARKPVARLKGKKVKILPKKLVQLARKKIMELIRTRLEPGTCPQITF